MSNPIASGKEPLGGVESGGFLGTIREAALVVTVTFTVALLVPSIVTDVGCTAQVEWAGAPEQDKFTTWLNPPNGAIVMS